MCMFKGHHANPLAQMMCQAQLLPLLKGLAQYALPSLVPLSLCFTLPFLSQAVEGEGGHPRWAPLIN